MACKQKGKFGGGFRPATKSFSFLLVGSIDGEKLGFTGKVRHGFDRIRRVGFRDRQTLRTRKCSFTNLPHCKAGPFDEDVASEEMDSLV